MEKPKVNALKKYINNIIGIPITDNPNSHTITTKNIKKNDL